MKQVERAVLGVRIHADLRKRGETIKDQAEKIQQITGGDKRVMQILVDLAAR